MLDRILNKENLTQQEAELLMSQIMSGEFTENQISGILVALAAKGEMVDEITGFARAMREKATKIPVDRINGEIVFDCCGTGGTGSGVFNVSTLVALIIAAAGIKVAKHGNRGATSKCGSADILENLGLKLISDTTAVSHSITQTHFGFLFAPFLHKAMKYAIQPRRELGVRTVFNILGPLTNPADANYQLMGVFDSRLTETIAKVLGNLGVKRAMVVNGDGNLDEVSTIGKTKISELNNGVVKTFFVTPEQFGIQRAKIEDIRGGEIQDNLRIAMDILRGKKGPKRDIVVLNASFALKVCDAVESIEDGIVKVEQLLDSGKVLAKLQQIKELSAK
ncbi:MAG: anthranilate phosphoribosyltransferase [Fidelibacterota bacterium]